MGLDQPYIPGQTPLEEEEREGLRIFSISTRKELDEFEQQNIEEAIQWLLTHKIRPNRILTESFIKEIHSLMFGQVWDWAGTYRKTNKNLGVDKWQIATELKKLVDDTVYWIQQKSFEPDEIAIRFKHRIVSIHCFPNGNGRHSRLMGDIMAEFLFNRPVFSWGSKGYLVEGSEVRTLYLSALRLAGRGDISSLIKFARS